MEMPDVNYWAILVCSIASMVLGSIWYGPLFGKTWQHLIGWSNVSEEKKQAMMKSMNKSYGITFVGSLITAYVLSHMITFSQNWFHTSFVQAGLTTGFWVWLGFVAPNTLGSVLWEGKSWKLWFINNGYNLILLLMFGLIIGSWR